MKDRLFSTYELLVLRKPLITLLLSFFIIGWLSTHIPSFKLDASSDSLVLESDQALKYYREIGRRYQSEEFLLVTYRPEAELLSAPVLATIDQLRTELLELKGVSSVVTILDVPLLASPKVSLEEIASGENIRTLRTPGIDKDLVKTELTSSPIYRELLTSIDAKTTALQVNIQRDEIYHQLLINRETVRQKIAAAKSPSAALQQELNDAQQALRERIVISNEHQSQLVQQVRNIIVKYRSDAQLFLGGVPMIAADMISFVKSDLVVFGTGIIIFIILTMGFIFRRASLVFLPLLSCVLTAAFMLGLITWMDWRMTVISSNFVALLLIITLSINIHLVVRYRELLNENPELSQQELVSKAARLMIKPCLYTTLTTLVSFASLVISGIRPVIDFGWMMTIGVSAALVITFLVLPAGMLLIGKPKSTALNNTNIVIPMRFAALTERHGVLILWAGLLLTLISVFGVTRLQVENRFIDYFHKSTEIYQGMEIIDAQLGGTIPLEVIIDAEKNQPVILAEANNELSAADAVLAQEFDDAFGDDFADDFSMSESGEEVTEPSYWFNRAGLSRIEQVHDYLDSLSETGKVLSLATSYKTLRELTDGIDDIQLALIQQKLPDDIRSILIDPYLDEEIDQARIAVRVMETSHTLRRDELLAQINTHLVNELGFEQEQVHLTGMLVLYNNMLQSLYRSQILTIGAVFIAILIMFVVLFRSFKIAMIALAPNLLSASLVLGGMGLVGIPLDIMTVTIAAITIGIAVDDTIHYVHRFQTEFKKDHNYLATMYRCHGSIGRAMFYTSVIIVIGFSILALSNFTPSIYFGLLTGTAMLAALTGALLLLPQLLITIKPLGPNVETVNDQQQPVA